MVGQYDIFRFILIFSLFVYGSLVCKNFLDLEAKPPVKENTSFANISNFWVAKVLLLDKSVALSQFFQMQLIKEYGNFPDIKGRSEVNPSDEGESEKIEEETHVEESHDHVNERKQNITTKYMLTNESEFFRFHTYYQYVYFSLLADPNNEFVREWVTHLNLNSNMVRYANLIFEKVFKKHPYWYFAFNIGWLEMYCLKDYDRAKTWFEKASQCEGAPSYIKNMLHSAFILGKRFDLGIKTTKEQIEKTKDLRVRKKLVEKLEWFKTLNLLEEKASDYSEKFQKSIQSLNDLISSGFLKAIPTDPIGEGYYWNKERGEADSYNNPFSYVRDKDPVSLEKIKIDSEHDH